MTTVCTGEAAYAALRDALQHPASAASFTCAEVPFERLRRAILDDDLSPLDRGIRLRHALRYADATLSSSSMRRAVPRPGSARWPSPQQCEECGLVLRAGDLVEAEPWRPTWLEQGRFDVDLQAMRQEARPWIKRLPTADYWMQGRFHYQHYRGPGQALAVRAALHMPTGEALLAVLPTGEGKSLVFQTLAAANPHQVVAVVVPTVALAQDHDNSTQAYGTLLGSHPHAYVGGQDQQNAEIVDRIATGEQGLLFAAPEAFVGRLQPALLSAAKNGKLAAVVVDEAHLVDAWGTDFRNEFQLLAALVAELRAQAPVHRQPRLVFLSATVTQIAYDTLRSLFIPYAPLPIVAGARLRPEPDTWIAPMMPDEDTRRARIIEALMHVPRPAILYVTKVEDAREWYKLAKDMGFRRVRALHGESSAADRSATIKAWSTGDLDLVIGTSAFGLGIDYPHVRTIIHACIPESLDRYYQEVGRSGRDNHASMALLVPTIADQGIAQSVARQKIISVEKGLARWDAMFQRARRAPDALTRFYVDTTVAPTYDMDMMGDRHEDWNGRVLSLMARAGLIAFAGLRFNPDIGRTELAVDTLDDGHRDPAVWAVRVEPIRQILLNTCSERSAGMRALLTQTHCPSKRLQDLYALDNGTELLPVVPACGGCAVCRAKDGQHWFANWPNPPVAPWPVGKVSARLLRHLDRGRGLIERERETFSTLSQRRIIREFIQSLWDDGIRKCLVIGGAPEPVLHALGERPWCTLQSDNAKLLSSNGLPPGPTVIWVVAGIAIPEHHFSPRDAGEERFFIIPTGLANPDRPGRLIGDTFPIATFNSLYESLQT